MPGLFHQAPEVNAEQFAHTVEPEVRMAKDPAAKNLSLKSPTFRDGRRLSVLHPFAPLRVHTRPSLFERRCGTPAQGPQGGQLWGEAVPAAGRVQGAGLGAASARRPGPASL